MKLIGPLLCLALLAGNVSAQDYKYAISEPIDVPIAGWNKVLQMKNGNTLFFHFEHRKGIIVKVFDKDHKEIASQKHLCEVLDINMLQNSFFDGIADINGEACIFITQQVNNKETAMLLRIDAMTGKLLEERKLIQSPSFHQRTKTDFLKDAKSDDYFFASLEKKPGFDETKISLKCFNAKHELVKEIPVGVDTKGFDKISIKESLINNEGGILLFIEMVKVLQYPDRKTYTTVLAYLPKGGDKFMAKTGDIPIVPKYFMHNTFAGTLNLFFTPTFTQRDSNIFTHTLMTINDDYSEVAFVPVNNNKLSSIVKSTIDTGLVLDLYLTGYFISKNGLTTTIYSNSSKPSNRNDKRPVKFGLGIVQLDDKGQEIWAGMINTPRMRSFKYVEMPEVFVRYKSADETRGLRTINYKNEFYTFSNSLDISSSTDFATVDKVYEPEMMNALCHKLNKKKEMSTQYIFGKPIEGENKLMYSGSGDFKDETGIYAAVMEHRKGKDIKTKIAWVQLES